MKLNQDNFAKAFGKTEFVLYLEKGIQEDVPWSFNYVPKISDDGWHPSGDCTPSLYELWEQATGVSEPQFVDMNKTFQVGHFWHQYLQHVTLNVIELCDESAIERQGERRWGDDAFEYCTGSADIAPVVLPNGKKILVDFKTMGSYAFRNADPPAYAIDKWECQMNVYMDLFDLDEAIIVGINKDSPHELKEFKYYRNQPLTEAIYQKWELVSMCLKEGIAPPKDEDIELPLKGHSK